MFDKFYRLMFGKKAGSSGDRLQPQPAPRNRLTKQKPAKYYQPQPNSHQAQQQTKQSHPIPHTAPSTSVRELNIGEQDSQTSRQSRETSYSALRTRDNSRTRSTNNQARPAFEQLRAEPPFLNNVKIDTSPVQFPDFLAEPPEYWTRAVAAHEESKMARTPFRTAEGEYHKPTQHFQAVSTPDPAGMGGRHSSSASSSQPPSTARSARSERSYDNSSFRTAQTHFHNPQNEKYFKSAPNPGPANMGGRHNSSVVSSQAPSIAVSTHSKRSHHDTPATILTESERIRQLEFRAAEANFYQLEEEDRNRLALSSQPPSTTRSAHSARSHHNPPIASPRSSTVSSHSSNSTTSVATSHTSRAPTSIFSRRRNHQRPKEISPLSRLTLRDPTSTHLHKERYMQEEPRMQPRCPEITTTQNLQRVKSKQANIVSI